MLGLNLLLTNCVILASYFTSLFLSFFIFFHHMIKFVLPNYLNGFSSTSLMCYLCSHMFLRRNMITVCFQDKGIWAVKSWWAFLSSQELAVFHKHPGKQDTVYNTFFSAVAREHVVGPCGEGMLTRRDKQSQGRTECCRKC